MLRIVDPKGDSKRPWGALISDIQSALEHPDARACAYGPKTETGQFLAEAATHFRYVKNAWRDVATHELKSYDREKAEEILYHTRSFVEHLAQRVHE